MEAGGFLKESSLNAEEIFRLISGSANLMDALRDAIYVQVLTNRPSSSRSLIFLFYYRTFYACKTIF